MKIQGKFYVHESGILYRPYDGLIVTANLTKQIVLRRPSALGDIDEQPYNTINWTPFLIGEWNPGSHVHLLGVSSKWGYTKENNTHNNALIVRLTLAVVSPGCTSVHCPDMLLVCPEEPYDEDAEFAI